MRRRSATGSRGSVTTAEPRGLPHPAPVLGRPGAAPRLGEAVLDLAGADLVAAVEQTERVAVLVLRAGLGPELAQRLPGHDGVLVGAELVLQLLETLAERVGLLARLAAHRAHDLDGVAHLLAGLAGAVDRL